MSERQDMAGIVEELDLDAIEARAFRPNYTPRDKDVRE